MRNYALAEQADMLYDKVGVRDENMGNKTKTRGVNAMNRHSTGKKLLSLAASLALCAGGIMAVLPSPTTAEETEQMIYQDSSGKYTFAERAADLVSRMTLQ